MKGRQAIQYTSHAEHETLALGEALAQYLKPPMTIALFGPLGSGKTVFVRGIARGLGISRVRSPSFLIMLKYPGKEQPLYHLDLYRLEDWEELIHLGILEVFEYGLVAVEWADRILDLLPPDRIEVRLDFFNRGRRLSLQATGPRSSQVIQALVNQITPRLRSRNP